MPELSKIRKDGVDYDLKDSKARNGLSNAVKTVNGIAPDGKGNIEIEISDSSEKVPDYWQAHIDEKIALIRETMESAGRNKSAFLFYADAHWNDNSQQTPVLLKYLYNGTPINKTIFGGDIVANEPTSDTVKERTIMEYLWDWRKQIRDVPNHHSVVGNHDDGNTTNNLFPDNYVYAYLFAPEENNQMVQGGNTYYYIDEPCEKTRYLYLDTAYRADDYNQIIFVTNALKSTPDGWHIIAVAHIWYDMDYTNNPAVIGGCSYTSGILLDLFENYNARSGDFTGCGGKVEFCVGGHAHMDYISASDGGIPIILTTANKNEDRNGLDCTAGTINETAITAFVADYTANTLTMVRIGRGEDRTIDLATGESEIMPTYENVLDTVGYKSGYRLSASSGGETQADGYVISGYLPVKEGDTIYLKNVTMPDNASDNYQCFIGYYYSDKSFKSGYKHTSTTENVEFGDDGNLCKIYIFNEWFDEGGDGETGYIRLCTVKIDDTSIVTINQPIE